MERTPRGWVALLLLVPFCATATEPVPRLVLQITVDQLRGDLPFRYEARYAKGGFRYLLDEGVWYTNAHHAHACTETIVGHTTLATGADSAVHGMVSNVWFDRNLDRLVYNVEDARFPILTPGAGVDAETEFDPTQVIAGSDGRSPAAIRTTTLGDGLSLSSAGSRSGDVYVVYRPHWFINDFDGLAVSSVHGSPWRHDSHVPIVFAGFGLRPGRPGREVHTVDVASTLAAVVGSSLPASAVGEPLAEVAPGWR